MARLITGLVLLGVAGAVAAGCGPPQNPDEPLPQEKTRGGSNPSGRDTGSVTGGGLSGLFADDEDDAEGGGSGVAVNSFLWRASLDTVSFMPLAQADPFGGVIITDWYSPADAEGERIKVNVFILSRELRANALRASVFRQVREDGEWVDAEVSEDTATRLENAILSRAREMRVTKRKQS
ncbi:protein of unknown function [Limimonas halophila]|uniref:DUF3576 domain-containing protein n=1 Tax=Limimonas halophila TaxID=1082479 RepID=A0A1G7SN64_9PROT|nr:DUF3576 domain-containing protein [Limimonas halophila]SDG24495.1 protein of unknown function [Limimonas halophila]